MMTLFEKRIYVHRFFKKLHTVLTSHTTMLNSGEFISIYAQESSPDAYPAYMIEEARQKQVLAVISSLCCQHNYNMKDYMRLQKHSSNSYDLLEATVNYLRALLPYMCYGPTYELLQCCLHTLLEFVDGSNQDDTNVLYVAENGYVKIACALLSFIFFLDADLNLSKTKR